MTQIIFYTGVANLHTFIYRFLQNKIYSVGKRALIVGEEPTIQKLDDSLWDTGFLPHTRLEEQNTDDVPILLSAELPPPEYTADVLISLHANQPSFLGQFPVYVDIVGTKEAEKQKGRERYRYFQEHGYPLSCHQMR